MLLSVLNERPVYIAGSYGGELKLPPKFRHQCYAGCDCGGETYWKWCDMQKDLVSLYKKLNQIQAKITTIRKARKGANYYSCGHVVGPVNSLIVDGVELSLLENSELMHLE